MTTILELIDRIKSKNIDFDESLIKKAFIIAKGAHGNQTRHSGEAYFSHPVAVAEIIIDLKLDQDSIIAGLLHDVVEDTEITVNDIEKQFGKDVAMLVEGVTKLGKLGSIPSNDKVAENFRKLAMAMSKDIRVLLIKLADRLHNMRTLFYVPSREKRIKKAQESLDIYAPLAGRIGLEGLKNELQDLAFAIIDPENRNYINNCLAEIREKNQSLIDKIIEHFKQLFIEEGIDCKIYGREKKPYSIWLNMQKRNVGFHNLHDIIAFRIITKSVFECYRVLGIVNSTYRMIPKSFKDYISTPKDNGYKSLHLVTLGPLNKKIEIQICDEQMHEVSDNGVASHWYYKEKYSKNKVSQISALPDHEEYRWIKELISLFENSENSSEALKQYKFSMHKNEVFCFTPNGDIFNLPFGATVVDFAYAIHSDIGNHCNQAKVNGIVVPLRQKLENGDQVEIITSKTTKPSPAWLQFVVTSKAKVEIKHFIRNEKYEEYVSLGRGILKKFFLERELDFNDKLLEKVLTKFRKNNVEDIYFRVSEGIISRNEVLNAIYPDYKNIKHNKSDNNFAKYYQKHSSIIPICGLIKGMILNYCNCCRPIFGDEIIGVIDIGSGIIVHHINCKNLKNIAIESHKILNLTWNDDEKFENEKYLTKISVIIENDFGSFADVSSIISKKNVDIKNLTTVNRSQNYFELLIDIEVNSKNHLEEILSSLLTSKRILEVKRVIN